VFEMRGKGEVRAGDLQVDAEVEVLNKDLHIATLNRDGDLRMGSRSTAAAATSRPTSTRRGRTAPSASSPSTRCSRR